MNIKLNLYCSRSTILTTLQKFRSICLIVFNDIENHNFNHIIFYNHFVEVITLIIFIVIVLAFCLL